MNAPAGSLGDFLIQRGIINTSQLEEARKKKRELSLPLGETLIRLKFVSEDIMLQALSEFLGVESLNIAENDYMTLDGEMAATLPLELCQEYCVLPLFLVEGEEGKMLTLAMADPLNQEALQRLANATGFGINPVLSTRVAIEGGISKLYDVAAAVHADDARIDEQSAVALFDGVLQKAVNLKTSDIHFEPHALEVHVRFRIDGILELAASYPSQMHTSVVSRIKVLASEQSSLMRIEEKRLPQDGSFSRTVDGRAIDARVSTLPTIFGEKLVMRLFDKDKSTSIGRIKDLRMSPRMDLEFRRCVRLPTGINLVTGPTGSGKTTTLGAAVNEVNDVGTNIVTVEDPVEYQAPDYINQSSLAPQAGYTYARALRAIMRQDPDVILIGEVRDQETAEIAVQAALTGHQVFATLHTDDAAGSVARLVDVGIEGFLVAATVSSAINQRLVRRTCPSCTERHVPTRIEMRDIGLDAKIIDEILSDPDRHNLRAGRGCTLCRKTGYKGRQGVYEMISMTPLLRQLIVAGKHTSDVITEAARKSSGVNMLFEEGLRLYLSGGTTLGELQNLPRGDYQMKPIAQIIHDAAAPA